MPWVAIVKWLGISLLFSLFPVILQFSMIWVQSGSYRLILALRGGELLIVSCGLAAGSIGDTLPARDTRMSVARVLFLAILLFTVAISTALYGAVVYSSPLLGTDATPTNPLSPDRIAALSIVVFVVSLLSSLISITISNWGDDHG